MRTLLVWLLRHWCWTLHRSGWPEGDWRNGYIRCGECSVICRVKDGVQTWDWERCRHLGWTTKFSPDKATLRCTACGKRWRGVCGGETGRGEQ